MTVYELIKQLQEAWAEADYGEVYIKVKDSFDNTVLQELEEVWIDEDGDICVGRARI